MIKYYLLENNLAKGEDKFMALVSNAETKNLNDIINLMIDEGTGLTRPQALAYFERLLQAISFWLQHGYAVNTPLVKFRASITGKFHDEFDNFDTARHQLNIRATAGSRIKVLNTATKLERTQVASQAPLPINFFDTQSGEENTTLTPGAICLVRGCQLSFDKTDPAQGVFIVPADTNEPAVRVEQYSLIKPQLVHFLCPELEAGEYTLQFWSTNKSGKELLTGSFKHTLNVG